VNNLRARCRLRREKYETRLRPSGRWGGGARADHRRAAAEHEPVPQHRVGGGGVSSSSSSSRRVGVSTVVYYPSGIAVDATGFFFLRYTCSSLIRLRTVPSFVRFLFGAIPSSYRVGFSSRTPPDPPHYPYSIIILLIDRTECTW